MYGFVYPNLFFVEEFVKDDLFVFFNLCVKFLFCYQVWLFWLFRFLNLKFIERGDKILFKVFLWCHIKKCCFQS